MPEKLSSGQSGSVRIPEGVTSPSYILHNAAKFYGNKVAMIDTSTGRRLLYSNLVSGVRRLVSALYKRGVRGEDNGDSHTRGTPYPRRPVVCIYSPNSIEIPLIVHAVLVLGGTITMADPELNTDDLFHQFQVLCPDYIIADRDKMDDAKFAASRIGRVKEIFVLGNHLRGHVTIAEMLTDDGRSVPSDSKINTTDDVSIVTFVNDIKGEPKGVMHSHHSFNSNVAILSCRNLSPVMLNDVTMCCHPMWSMIGLVFYCGVAIKEGATMIIQPTYSNILQAMSTHKVTIAHTNTHMAEYLSSAPEVHTTDLSCLCRIYNTGTAVREGVIGEIMVRTGVTEFREGFAIDEACAVCVVTKGETLPGYAGKVCPNTQIKFMDIIFGGVVEPDTYGEICVKGPQVMLGYLTKDDTEDTGIDDEGWLHTGNLGCIDTSELVTPFGKMEDLIESDQNFLSPVELEKIIRQHSDVEDVAVVGVPYRNLGHVPRAYVVRKPKATITEGDIYDHVADQVTLDKKLRGGVLFLCSLPRSPYGELLRHELRADAAQSFLDDLGEDDLGESFSNLDESDGEIYARKQAVEESEPTPETAEDTSTEALQWQEGIFKEEDFEDFGVDFLHFSALDTTTPELDAPIITFVEGLDGFITTRDRDEVEEYDVINSYDEVDGYGYGKVLGDGNNNTDIQLMDIIEEDEKEEEMEEEIEEEVQRELEVLEEEAEEELEEEEQKVVVDEERSLEEVQEEVEDKYINKVENEQKEEGLEEGVEDGEEEKEEQWEETWTHEEVQETREIVLPYQNGNHNIEHRNSEEQTRYDQVQHIKADVIKNSDNGLGESVNSIDQELSIVLPKAHQMDENESYYVKDKMDHIRVTNPGVHELLTDLVNNYQPPLRTSTPVPDSEVVVKDIDISTPIMLDEITKIDQTRNPVEETEVYTLSEIYDEHSSLLLEEQTEDYLPEETPEPPRHHGRPIAMTPTGRFENHLRTEIGKRQRPPQVKLVRDPITGALVVRKTPEKKPMDVQDGPRGLAHPLYNTRRNVKMVDRIMTPTKMGPRLEVSPTHYTTNNYGHYVSTKNLNLMPKHEPRFTPSINKRGLRHFKSTPDLVIDKKPQAASDESNDSMQAGSDSRNPFTSNLSEFRPEISRSVHDLAGHEVGGGGDIGTVQDLSAGSLEAVNTSSPTGGEKKKSKVKRFLRRFINQDKF